jgi:anti-sigma-K factor RskA
MTPIDRDARDVVAGQFVLGVLDPTEAHEVEKALAADAELRSAVEFWEQALHPLATLAESREPPPGAWDAIMTRIGGAGRQETSARSSPAAPWQWSTAGLAALAAALILYIVVVPPTRPMIATLSGPQEQTAAWVATFGRDGLHLAAVGREAPPSAHVYELWAIAKGARRPLPLGVIPASARFQLPELPRGVGQGATLAISVEPPGGSPTGQPTGPVLFTGTLRES